MSRRCERTNIADRDLFEVSLYIAQNRGIAAAERFIETINEKFQLLVNSPEIGRMR